MSRIKLSKKSFLVAGLILMLLLMFSLFGCTAPTTQENKFVSIQDGSICKEEGKPVIRMYSTSTCPHCIWVKPAFDSIAKEYVDANKIIAHHWEWIINEEGSLTGITDTLTNTTTQSISSNEEAVFNQFSPNSSVPVFVFGCKYYRIGTQFELQKDLNAEETEFRQIIEELLKE